MAGSRWKKIGGWVEVDWWLQRFVLDAVSRIAWFHHVICSCFLGGFLHPAFFLTRRKMHLPVCSDALLGRIEASLTHAFFLALPHHCLPSYPFTLCTERSSTVRDSRRCPSPCRGRTELSTQPRRMFQDFLTIDLEDCSMGGMTTVTLMDRRINPQHSRAGQDGCHTASSVGRMWDYFVVGGFF